MCLPLFCIHMYSAALSHTHTSQVRYSWRKDEFPECNFDDMVHMGFIAQDVETIVPEIVGTDKNGWKSVRYTQVVALLVEAVKNMNEVVIDLEQSLMTILKSCNCTSGASAGSNNNL